MNSQPFDPSCDAALGFISEGAVLATHEPEPAFMRPPLAGPPHASALSGERHAQSAGVWFVAMLSVLVGVVGGFAAGYAFAPGVIVPAAPPVSLHASSGTAQTARDDRLTEAAGLPNVAAPALPPRASAASVLPSESSNVRPATGARQISGLLATTPHAGAIEILSHPRDAQVLLDGNVVGRTPLSIAGVEEGTHEVRVELPGFDAWVTGVRVKQGSRARIGASLEAVRLK